MVLLILKEQTKRSSSNHRSQTIQISTQVCVLTIFSHCRAFDGEEEQPGLLSVIQQVWPLIEKVLYNYRAFEDNVKAACDLCRNMVCSVGYRQQTLGFVNTLFNLMCSFYENLPYSCVLDVISILVG
jgi:hypothetical protein